MARNKREIDQEINDLINDLPAELQRMCDVLDLDIQGKRDMLAELHMTPSQRVNRPRAQFDGRSYRLEQQHALDAFDAAGDTASVDAIKRVTKANQLVNRALRDNTQYQLSPAYAAHVKRIADACAELDAAVAADSLVDTINNRLAVKRREGKLSAVAFYEQALTLATAGYRVHDVARACHKWATLNGPASGAQGELDAISTAYAASTMAASDETASAETVAA